MILKHYESFFTEPKGKHFDMEVPYRDRDIKVRVFTGSYMPGSPGGWEEAPSGPEADIAGVYLLRGDRTGPEIWDRLDDRARDKILNATVEDAQDEIADRRSSAILDDY